MPTKTAMLLAVLAALLVGCGSAAHESDDREVHGEHAVEGTHATAGAPAATMNATCPVMDEDVDPEIYTEFKGKKVYFCCEDCVSTFKQDPEKYFAIAYPHEGGR